MTISTDIAKHSCTYRLGNGDRGGENGKKENAYSSYFNSIDLTEGGCDTLGV